MSKKNPSISASANHAHNYKVALVHDYLVDYGGAERVVEALHEIFPEAPLYTSFVNPKTMGIHWQKFADWDIRESWLTKIPLYKKIFSPLRLFAANAFESFDFSNYDVVISSSNAYFAKAVQVKKPALHICYCHTPPRSLYGYSTMTNWKQNPFFYVFGTAINHICRVIDVRVAQRVDYFLVNSDEVKQRVAKFYRRDATIIYPPVDVPEKLTVSKTSDDEKYFLYVGRIAQSKHVDLAIKACTELNLPLKIVGKGKGVEYLASLAGPTIEFLGSIPDEQLTEVYAGAKALIFPAEDEDFGIVPIEAMGHGVPVIAHRSGGPKETIVEEKTGLFFDQLTVESLKDALQKFSHQKFSSQSIFTHAQKFKKERFQKEVLQFINSKISSSKT
jgi:glycosyltransferase involved in cell wall biosynthesis